MSADEMHDASLDAAVSRIMGKVTAADVGGAEPEHRDNRESREDRDPIEREGTTDLAEAERDEREAEAEAETDEGADEAPDYFELPPETEGAEGERIPRAEAIEAVKQYRQMQGDIASAVIRVESEAMQKADAMVSEIGKMHAQVRQTAETVLASMPVPRPPPRTMLDNRYPDYNPENYHLMMLDYEDQKATYLRVQQIAQEAAAHERQANEVMAQTERAREAARLERLYPELRGKDAHKALVEKIGPLLAQRYGLTQADLNEVVDHRAWRLMSDLAKFVEGEAKAPEVRKQVQEKAAKLVNGRVPPARNSDGRFIPEARKELKETGSEDAFARLLMRSGALKGM